MPKTKQTTKEEDVYRQARHRYRKAWQAYCRAVKVSRHGEREETDVLEPASQFLEAANQFEEARANYEQVLDEQHKGAGCERSRSGPSRVQVSEHEQTATQTLPA